MERGWFLTDQFANLANPRAHETATGPEVLEQCGGRVGAFVCGVDVPAVAAPQLTTLVSWDRRVLRFEAFYLSSVTEGFGNLPSSPAYLSPAFLKDEPSSMYFRC